MSPDPLPRLNHGDRPSRLEQARHATGEIELEAGVDEDWLAALEGERSRLDPFDFEILRARAARLDERPPRRASPARGWWAWLGTALVAFSLLFALRPVSAPLVEEGLKGQKGGEGKGGMTTVEVPPPGPMAPGTGIQSGESTEKYIATLGVVVRRGERQFRATRQTEVLAGDLLGFRTFSGAYEQVVLVAVNEDGSVTPLESELGFGARKLHAGERGMLDFHVMVTDPVPPAVAGFFGEWTEGRIRATVQKAWSAGGLGGLRALAEAPDIEQVALRPE